MPNAHEIPITSLLALFGSPDNTSPPASRPRITAEPMLSESKPLWDLVAADALIANVHAARCRFERFGWPLATDDCRRLGVLFDFIDRAYLACDLAGLRLAVGDTLAAIGTMPGADPLADQSAAPPPEVLSAWRREAALSRPAGLALESPAKVRNRFSMHALFDG